MEISKQVKQISFSLVTNLPMIHKAFAQRLALLSLNGMKNLSPLGKTRENGEISKGPCVCLCLSLCVKLSLNSI